MVIFAESSALLSWLFDEPRSVTVIDAIDAADLVIISDLAVVECERAVHRAAKRGRIDQAQALALRNAFTAAAARWDRLDIGERVIALASGPFPVEPIRALDAIHLASAEIAREAWPELTVLSFDERIRANAMESGYSVLPTPP